MLRLSDQLGREVSLPHIPQRIVSLVPSQTELLFYLGLDAQIVGITKYCTHPVDKVSLKTKIGGTKQLDIEMIHRLAPDLIIANKEENERLQLSELMDEFPTYVSDPNDLRTALQLISDLGNLTDRKKQADKLVADIEIKFNLIVSLPRSMRVAYLIWRKPYMAAGQGTFINAMLLRCGLINVIEQERYPEVNIELLKNAGAEMILLSSEPYPFKQKHAAELGALLPGVPVKLVDGEMFSWYGSRLLEAADYFMALIASINSPDN